MSAIGTFGKIAGIIAFPVVFGGCCGGGGLVVAAIVALSATFLVRKIVRSRPKCETEIEMDT